MVILRVAGALALLGLLIASMAGASAQSQDSAGLRVVHAGIDSPPVDVSINGASVVEGLFWLEATEYVDLAAGDHEIAIFDPDTSLDEALASKMVSLEAGKNYSAVITGQLPTPEIVLLVDGSDEPIEAGMGGLRLFNSVPDDGPIDLIGMDSVTLVEGVEILTASDYVMAAAGSYEIEFYAAGTDNRIYIEQGLTVEEGVYQTVYLSGFIDPGNYAAEIMIDEFRAAEDGGEATATEEPAATQPPEPEPTATSEPAPTATPTPAPGLPSTGAGGAVDGEAGTNLLLFASLGVLCLAAGGGLYFWSRRVT